MKGLTIIFLLCLGGLHAVYGRHIKGGEISYVWLGPGQTSNSDRYEITLRLFLECNASGQQLDPDANIGIFRVGNEVALSGSPFIFPLVGDEFINLGHPDPCISNPSPVCYRLRTYKRVLEIPKDQYGYTFVFQRCCRINGLVNLSPNGNIGSSYTLRMHGTDDVGASGSNSSPSFSVKDTILICQNRPFQLDFSAEDPDGDSVSYEFVDAYSAPGGGGGFIDPIPPSQITYVSYANGFAGSTPLGNRVNLNPSTGLISGIAPGGGDYVISVSVKEWRGNRVISEHRKDFNIRVDNQCDLAAALLNPTYSNCDDFSHLFQNESPPSSLIHTYHWDFGVSGLTNDTSNQATPTYTYTDTGVYTIRLYINRNEQCSDSSSAQLSVFPGFNPDFTAIGSCIQNPYLFADITTASYGVINKWEWDFGDQSSTSDNSTTRTASWQYTTLGLKNVSLKVSSSKGCEETLLKTIEVRDKPILNLPFRDTLICSIDSLRLVANGPGIYVWSPKYNIIDDNSPFPIVYPKVTTWYKVDLNENGCVNRDSVRVRVVDFVTLNAGADTTICLTDSARLNPSTDGLRFNWTPANTLNNPTIKNPLASPTGTTDYFITAHIGKCNATDAVRVRTVPYPGSFAGEDTVVCFDDTARLNGSMLGSSFSWSPANTLSSARVLNPFAYPRQTTTYTLRVFDTIGCPKPGLSTVVVGVKPQIFANAGNDTVVVLGQPLQMRGAGGELNQWFPSTYLSNPNIPGPVAMLPDNFTYILKAYTPEGCYDLDTINIKVFKTGPDIFVPNAFAPAGRNNVLRPIPVGISQFDFFRVYNRYGQLVFQTSQAGRGWDGNIAGRPQQTGTYVWMVRGIDYTGNVILKRGTAILVR